MEVGLDPHAGRHGSAEFELRAVTGQGEVIASDIAIRKRVGLQSLPAVLRVDLNHGGASALQLVVNDQDGSAMDDLVVWADPLVYCEGSCPCTFAQEEAEAALTMPPLRSDDTSAARNSPSHPSVVTALLALALLLCAAALSISSRYAVGSSSTSRARVIGKVQMARRKASDERALIMEAEVDDIEDHIEDELTAPEEECDDVCDSGASIIDKHCERDGITTGMEHLDHRRLVYLD